MIRMHALMRMLRGIKMDLPSSTYLLNAVLHDSGLGFDEAKYGRSIKAVGDAVLGCGFVREAARRAWVDR